MVVGAATLQGPGPATYRNTSVDRSALDRLMELTSGVTGELPTSRYRGYQSPERRHSAGHEHETAVAPVWEGITIIPDEVTKAAKKGQLVITAVMLYAMKVLRKDGAGLVKQGTDHS